VQLSVDPVSGSRPLCVVTSGVTDLSSLETRNVEVERLRRFQFSSSAPNGRKPFHSVHTAYEEALTFERFEEGQDSKGHCGCSERS